MTLRARIALPILFAALLGACATRGPEHRELVELNQPTRVEVSSTGFFLYTNRDRREIRAFAPAPTAFSEQQFRHATIQLHPVDALTFQRLRGRDERRPVTVLTPADFLTLRQQIADEIVPREPGKAITILARGAAAAFYRDGNGDIEVTAADHLPCGTESVAALDFESAMVRGTDAVISFITELPGNPSRVLLPTTQDPHRGMIFFYFDLEASEAVMLTLPLAAETGGPAELATATASSLGSIFFRSHILTFIKNPVTSLTRLVNYLTSSAWLFATDRFGGVDINEDVRSNGQERMDLVAWNAQLDDWGFRPQLPGTIEFLVGGQAFFDALYESINRAEHSIQVRLYIVDNDDVALNVIDLLKRKAEAGVDVQVMFDELGSLLAGRTEPAGGVVSDIERPDNIYRYIKDSEIRVRRATNPWFTGDHVKTIIVDGKEVYTGGMNLGREYRHEWHDLMVRVTGPIVDQVGVDFERAWKHAGPGGDLAYGFSRREARTRETPRPDEMMLRPIYTRTIRKEILRAHREAIRRARERIWIANSYVSLSEIVTELARARQRGVDVRVILPAENNHGVMGANNLVVANFLLEAGVRVYAYPGMSHVKASVFDGWASVGSANYDKLSFYINQEFNLTFSDEDAIRQLEEAVFQPDMSASAELKEPLPTSWSDHIYTILARQL